jgi:hypothetical protein
MYNDRRFTLAHNFKRPKSMIGWPCCFGAYYEVAHRGRSAWPSNKGTKEEESEVQ